MVDQVLPPELVATIDARLREIDDEEVAAGRPILSVLCRDDATGKVGQAFWDAVEKHKLRLPGEGDAALITRLEEAAWAFHQDKDGRACLLDAVKAHNRH